MDYERPGPAYRHTQGMLLALREDLTTQILHRPWDEQGRDRSEFLRAELLAVEAFLAVPELVRRELAAVVARLAGGPAPAHPTPPDLDQEAEDELSRVMGF